MNTATYETAAPKNKKDRSVIMAIAACVISMLGILAEKLYSGADALPYNTSMLFLISFIASSILFSCALTVLSQKSKQLIWIVPIVSMLAVGGAHIALGASASDTLLALAFIPSSVTVSICISNACEKAHTVVANAVILALVFLSSVLLEHYEIFGEISAASLGYTKEYFKESFLSLYSSYNYASLGITVAQISDAFDAAILVIPSIFCMLVSVISYAEITLARLLVLDRGICSENISHWPLKMSRLASFVFLASFICVILAAFQESNIFFVTAANLTLILIPGFFLIGLRTSPTHFRRPGLFGIIFGIFIIVTCLQNPLILLLIVSVGGAFDNLFSAFRERLYGEKKK